MPRRLGVLEHLKIIEDPESDTEIHLYHRPPTNKERALYQQRSVTLRRGEVHLGSLYDLRLEFGMKILQRFRDGDFEEQEADGSWIALSCDPEALPPKRYKADWRSYIEQHAGDLIAAMAQKVFELPSVLKSSDSDEGSSDDVTAAEQEPTKNSRKPS